MDPIAFGGRSTVPGALSLGAHSTQSSWICKAPVPDFEASDQASTNVVGHNPRSVSVEPIVFQSLASRHILQITGRPSRSFGAGVWTELDLPSTPVRNGAIVCPT